MKRNQRVTIDPYEFTKIVKAAFKLKSYFQKQAAIKRVALIAEEKRNTIQEIIASDDKEGLALKEFVLQLKAKKLTPEAFFRVCDVSYSKSVSIERFQDCINDLGIKLTSTQFQRLILILDEDFQNHITLEEYQHALEAYQLAGERHFLANKGSTKPYYPVQNQVFETLVNMMLEKNMTVDELFSMCDTDGSGFISASELKSTVSKIQPTILIKEKRGIEGYFSQFDSNGDGKISREEFNCQFDRIERIVERKKQADVVNEFSDDSDGLARGDENFFNDGLDKAKAWLSGKPAASTSKTAAITGAGTGTNKTAAITLAGSDDANLVTVLKQMEADGLNLQVFFNVCKDYQVTGDKMQNSQFILLFQSAYPRIAADQINLLISKAKLTEKEISFSLLQQLFNKQNKTIVLQADKLLTFVANFMFNVEKTISKSTDANQNLTQSFTKYLAQVKINGADITMAGYTNLNKAVCKMRPAYSETIYNSVFKQSNNGSSVFVSEVRAASFNALSVAKDLKSATPIKQASLDEKIPGFSRLSPRSKSDSAVTFMIQQMKQAKIQSIQVFNSACDPKAESALNQRIIDSFKKFFTNVDAALIDAACASFGAGRAMVSKATFVNTFDESIDKSMKTVPNSANLNPSKSRPATASAVIPIKGNEADMLIRKLDNVMLKQGISPLVAFKKADADGNGVIQVNELKNAIQTLLPTDEIKPADFKMLMMAFDVNRNGRIEEDEFINAFVKARENSLASQDQPKQQPVEQAKPSKSVAQPQIKNEITKENLQHLLLKVILYKAGKGTTYSLPYWEPEEALPDLAKFTTEVCTSQKILTPQQAKLVYESLRQDSQTAYQSALDLLYNKLVDGHESKQSADGFKLIKDIAIDQNGFVKVIDASKVFVKIHFADRQMLQSLNELEQEIGIKTEEWTTQRELMHALPALLKSFFVQVSSIPDDEEPTHVNYLAFATGIWLERAETLNSNSLFDKQWSEIVYHYFAILYSQLKEMGATAEAVHSALLKSQSFQNNLKVIKSMGLTKWIRLLDNETDLRLARNVKCLQARDSRINLPLMMAREENTQAFLKNLAIMVTTQPVGQAVKSTTESLKKEDIVAAIERELQDDISKVLLPYATQDFVPLAQLIRSFQTTKNKVSRSLIESLCKEATPGNYAQQGVKIGDLVRFVCLTPSKFNHDQFIKAFSAQIKSPVRETLLSFLQEFDKDGMITKDEFLCAFAKIEDAQINKWSLVCLFYRLDLADGFDEMIKFETLVESVSLAKGLPYQAKQTQNIKQDQQKQQVEQTAVVKKPVTDTKALDIKKPEAPVVVKKQEEVKNAGGLNEVKKPATDTKTVDLKKLEAPVAVQKPEEVKNAGGLHESHVAAPVVQRTSMLSFAKQIYENKVTEAQVQKDLNLQISTDKIDELVADDYNVLKFCQSLVLLQKQIINQAALNNVLAKTSEFIWEQAEGNNQERYGGILYKEIVRLQEINKIPVMNVLLIRAALLQFKRNNKTIYDLFDLLILGTLFLDRECMHRLEEEEEFFQAFIKIPDFKRQGNEGEVKEFQDDCWLKLQQAFKEANKIIAAAQQKPAGEQLQITQNEVWDNVRFYGIAQKLKTKLADPKIKKLFIDRFTKQADNLLTYFEFYKLCNEVITENRSTDWEYEDLMYWLDDFNLLHINFNDVNIWLKEYGCDLGIPIEVNKNEESFKKNNNIAPNQYVIGEKDYFRGIKTIFNSEIAALAYAEQLFEECEQKNINWFDPDFGPQSKNPESDEYLQESAEFMYINGIKPRGYTDPNQVVWKSPSEYLKEGGNNQVPAFIIDDLSSNEVKQGAIGDCWFIGAMSVVATKDEYLRGGAGFIEIDQNTRVNSNIAILLSKGVYPPIFHKFKLRNIYVLRFFKDFKWRYVFIDDRLPVSIASLEPVFASCRKSEELWVPLIEKAYAKLFGCYETLISGFIDDGVVDLTGLVCEKRTLQDKDGLFTENVEEFWEFLIQNQEDGSLMGCSVAGGGTESKVIIDGVNCGILSGHAYAINDVFEVPGKVGKRSVHRILRIRNPWGRGEWNGKWSDESLELEKYKEKLNEYINNLEEDERFILGDEDGTFLINYKEWRNVYNKLFIAIDFEPDWNSVRFESAWTPSSSGGVPLAGTEEQKLSFIKNPQFFVCPSQNCELFVSLGQDDGRVRKADGSYDKYPFTKTMSNAILFIYELPPGQDKLTSMDVGIKLKMEKPTVLIQISTRVKLIAGKKYVVIPAIKNAGATGEFYMSFYFDIPMYMMDIRNLTDPTNRYSQIEEESEKVQKTVPHWKISWVKHQTLGYMIGKNELSKSIIEKSKAQQGKDHLPFQHCSDQQQLKKRV